MQTLGDRIARGGALTPFEAVGWVIRMCKRLGQFHALGVAHGSISAECIMIESSSPGERGLLVDLRRVPNLAHYHSPERTGGAGMRPADDTWSAAVTLYLAVSGVLPFSGTSPADLRTRILAASPEPLAAHGIDEPKLQAILDRAFARDVAQRLSDLAELQGALESWSSDPTLSALPPLDEEEEDDDDDDDRTIVRPSTAGVSPMLHALRQESMMRASVASQAPPRGHDSGAQEPSAARPADGTPVARESGRTSWFVAAAVAVLVAAGSAYALIVVPRWRARPSDVAAATSSEPRPPAPPESEPDAAADAGPANVATSSEQPVDEARREQPVDAGQASACLLSFFPPDTFTEPAPDLAFVCSETDPRRGSRAVRAQVVKAGAGVRVSEGMREWASLGWYEMAAFAVLRARCCSQDSAPLGVPYSVQECPDIVERLEALGKAATKVSGPEMGTLEEEARAYADAVACLGRTGASSSFGSYPPLKGAEQPVFKKILSRL